MEHENIPHVQGGISSSGIKYFEIGGPGINMCLQAAELSSKSKFDHALEAHQLILTPHQRAQIILQASKVLDFPNPSYS